MKAYDLLKRELPPEEFSKAVAGISKVVGEDNVEEYVNGGPPTPYASLILLSVLNWGESEEGWDYWNEVCLQLPQPPQSDRRAFEIALFGGE